MKFSGRCWQTGALAFTRSLIDMKNILSIDMESWVHFYDDALKAGFSGKASSQRKLLDNNYIPDATEKILNLLEKYDQKVTFFVLGELYEWYPETINEIEKRGHEIAYHTHSHVILANSEKLEKQLKLSDDFIERFKPIGFRAPQIFITRDSMACLKKRGFKYSSSTYDEYKVDKIEGIDEIPVSAIPFRKSNENDQRLPKQLTIKMLTRQIPFGSGLFIALLGSKTSRFVNRLNKRNIPAVLFIHPWQLFRPEKIKNISFKLKVLYRNLLCAPYTVSILKPVEELLRNHEFTSFKKYYYE